MSRHPLILLICLLATACASERGGKAIERPVQAGFAAGSQNVIEIEVTDPQPAESIELVAPDGRVQPARQILRDRVVEERDGGIFPSLGIGVGVTGGSSSRVGTSVGIGLPLGGLGKSPRAPKVTSRARIAIEDMAAYRASWQDWTVRIRLGEPEAGGRIMEVPAPRPPAAG